MDRRVFAEDHFLQRLEELSAFPTPTTVEEWERLEMIEIAETTTRRLVEQELGAAPA